MVSEITDDTIKDIIVHYTKHDKLLQACLKSRLDTPLKELRELTSFIIELDDFHITDEHGNILDDNTTAYYLPNNIYVLE